MIRIIRIVCRVWPVVTCLFLTIGHAQAHQDGEQHNQKTFADATWQLFKQGDLPGNARTRSPDAYSREPEGHLAQQQWLEAMHPPLRAKGLQQTAFTRLSSQHATRADSRFSVELLVLEHVNQPVGALVTSDPDQDRWVLGFVDDTAAFGPVKEGRPLLVEQLEKEEKYEGRWWHIVGSFDGKQWCLFVNAVEQSCVLGDGVDSQGLGVAGFTAREPHMTPADLLHEVSTYSRELSPSEVRQRFELVMDRVEAGMLSDDGFHITAGPWLHLPAEDAMSVLIETNQPSTAVIYAGPDKLEPVLKSEKLKRLHRFRLTELESDTRYYYRLALSDASGETIDTPVLTFQTAVADHQPFTFAFMGDTEARPHVNRAVAEAVWGERPHFAVLLGDLTDGGFATRRYEWTHEFFAGLGALGARVPMVAVPGNGESDLVWFHHYNPYPDDRGYYSYRYGDAEFFVLDSNLSAREKADPGFRERQRQFLLTRLAGSNARWKIAMHHHPVFTSDENDFGDTWRSPALHQGDPEVRADWLDIYEQYDVDLVLYGHMHIYERSRPMVAGRVEHNGGVVYVGAGGAGGNLEDLAPTRNAYTRKTFRGYHYGLVDVTQGRLAITIRDTEGRVRDRFTIPAGEARSRK